RRYVFLVGGDGPDMAERIGDRAAAIAVELILECLLDRTACGDGFGELGVDIGNVEQQADRGAAERLRALVAHLDRLVREHYDALADLDFGVTDRAARAGKTHQFRGTEGFLVELQGARRTANDKVRGDAGISAG